LKVDPTFALAWARLSTALSLQGERQESHIAAEQALKLDPTLPEAHVALGYILINGDLDLVRGEEQINQALRLNPNDGWALAWVAALADMRGQSERSIKLAKQLVLGDPTNARRHWDLVGMYVNAGRYDDARDAYLRFLEFSPKSAVDRHCWLAGVEMMRGDANAALAELNHESDPTVLDDCNARVNILDALGRKADADAVFARILKRYANEDPYGIATIYAARREFDRAFEWLERAYKMRETWVLYMKVDPWLKNLRPDPRFKALLHKIGLPE
jgi:tetratricopeptide (TPR) repeat protein